MYQAKSGLNSGLSLHLGPTASREGSEESAHTHRLSWASAACWCNKYTGTKISCTGPYIWDSTWDFGTYDFDIDSSENSGHSVYPPPPQFCKQCQSFWLWLLNFLQGIIETRPWSLLQPVTLAIPLHTRARPVQSLEPILFPKLWISVADFPYLYCSTEMVIFL